MLTKNAPITGYDCPLTKSQYAAQCELQTARQERRAAQWREVYIVAARREQKKADRRTAIITTCLLVAAGLIALAVGLWLR